MFFFSYLTYILTYYTMVLQIIYGGSVCPLVAISRYCNIAFTVLLNC